MLRTLLLLTTAATLSAQDPLRRDLAAAAAISNQTQRLQAYDAIVALYQLGPVANTGKWQIRYTKSPIDDSTTVTCGLDSNAPVRVGDKSVTPRLVVRLKEGRLAAYIDYDGVPLGSGEKDVTLRFGKEDRQVYRWKISTDHKAVFVGGDVADFLKKLGSVDSLVVRLIPPNESEVTVTFAPAGVQQVVEVIAATARKNSSNAPGTKSGSAPPRPASRNPN